MQKAIFVGRYVATSVPGVAIGVQAIWIMPKHHTGWEYSLTSGRNAADVMDMLMYQVCPVHKGQQSLAPAGSLMCPRSSTRTCSKWFPSWEVIEQRSYEAGLWKNEVQ